MSSGPRREALIISLILAATLCAYLPAYRAGFIWDDDAYVTNNPTLTSIDGLRRIWFEVGATPQYYPLVFTTFWIERHLWGLTPAGYHVVNVLLHLIAALLAWRVMLRLGLPGAVLAAGLFALHPVQVESVAWVTERKNVLSGALYFAALLAYLRFAGIGRRTEEPVAPRWNWYAISLALFVAALLSKTVTGSLPAAIAVLLWWKQGRIAARQLPPLIPMMLLALGFGALTSWVEHHHVGVEVVPLAFSPAERILIAGRAAWFYASKLLWPAPLTFIYPRWRLDTADWTQWLWPVGTVLLLAAAWTLRRRLSRGPLAALLLFGGTLIPALGFISVFPMRYSFVADHFQYLAAMPMLALLAAAWTRHGPRGAGPGVAAAVLLILGILTMRQTTIYRDPETLWRDTLAKNPACAIAHNNLGLILDDRQSFEEAFAHYGAAVEADPAFAEAEINYARYLIERKNDVPGAIERLRHTLALTPTAGAGHHMLGIALARQRDGEGAIACFRRCIELDPRDFASHYMLGRVLFAAGRTQEAIASVRRALEIEPRFTMAQRDLAAMLAAPASRPPATSRTDPRP